MSNQEDWDYSVRHRAYELWQAAGRPDGQHLRFWEAAERELRLASLPPADLGHGEITLIAAE